MTGPTHAPTRLRVLLHAADRTGPPMLARALLRQVSSDHPEVQADVVAFRGGEMLAELEALGPVTVLLHDHEAWDHAAPDPVRVAELEAVTGALDRPDAVLLVSISGGQCLPYFPETSDGPGGPPPAARGGSPAGRTRSVPGTPPGCDPTSPAWSRP